MKPFVPVTVTCSDAVPPTATGKVVAVVARLTVWLVAASVRLTLAVPVADPLFPVMVIDWAPAGTAIFPAVVIVKITFAVDVPLSDTLVGLKVHRAPAGRPAVQLPGLDAVELVKVTA